MAIDYIAKHMAWLDGLFTDERNPNYFNTENQLQIQKEISTRWCNENRLELLNTLAEQFGMDNVLDVVDKILYENSRSNWEKIGKSTDNSLSHFIKILWGPLKDQGFEYTSEEKNNQVLFSVTKCPMYELAKMLNAEKWFYHLLCLGDEPSVVGFNSNIKFTRTLTLMQGNSECDHCYTNTSVA